MRKTLRVTVLVLALYGSAFAGDIPTPSGPQPAAKTEVAGDIPCPSVTEPTEDGDMQFGLTATWLSMFESMLALF